MEFKCHSGNDKQMRWLEIPLEKQIANQLFIDGAFQVRGLDDNSIDEINGVLRKINSDKL